MAPTRRIPLGRLGVPVRLVGMVGSDAFGEFVLGRLASAGVDTGGIRRSAAPTATSVVLVNGRGDRRFLHRLGSSGEMFLEPDAFEREIQPGMSHYHLATPFTLPRMRAIYPELLRRARARGLTTSLDTQWDSQGKWMADLAPCLPYVDVLFANEDEARMLTGATDPARIAAVLREHGASTIVLKLGAQGCAVFSERDEFQVPAFPVTVGGHHRSGRLLRGRMAGRNVSRSARPERRRAWPMPWARKWSRRWARWMASQAGMRPKPGCEAAEACGGPQR